MASRTILHVGTMKSGTSYVQSRLFENRDVLAEAGILVPGEVWQDQRRAVSDALRIQRRGARRATGDWHRIVEQIAAHPGTVVVSMEFLGPATPEEIAGICRPLTGIEVVVTARDLNRNLAAMWQETLQNGSTWSYRAFLDSAEEGRPETWTGSEPPPKPGRAFWRQQDVVRIVRNWREHGPVTVITLPPPGAPRSLLWERFCQVLGVPASGWADATRSNESLGAASAALLRQVNLALVDAGLEGQLISRVRKFDLAKVVLAARRRQEPSIGLPVAPWVVEHATRTVAELSREEVDLIGDWRELDPVAVPGVDPEDVSPDEVIGAAAAGLAGMIGRVGRDVVGA